MPNNSSAGSEILSRLQQAPTIHPASASLFTDWSLEPGDVVTVKSDEEAYMVPIYTMLMEWTGSSKVEISSSGNQKREPLPALTRRDYATRSAINGMRQKMEDQEEINQQYQHWRTETNQQLTSVYKITGVKLDANGKPIYQQAKDAQGNPLWETDGQGNYVLDEDGNRIPILVYDEAGNPVPVYDPDSTGSISGTVTQTAQSLNILYEQTGGVTEKFDPEKQYHAGDYVLSPNGVSCRFKVDHLGPWSNEDVVSVPNLQAQITTNANEISSRVTQTSLTQTLGSYITQNAYSASIGAFLDENGKVSAAKIVTEINKQTGESKVIISADMVELDGLVTVSDLFSEGGAYVQDTIHVGGLHVYEDVSIDGGITTSADSDIVLGTVECTSLTALEFLYVGDIAITNAIVAATVGNNTLTLTDASGNTVNFSKATTLNTSDTFTVNGASVTAGWSGGTYTVVATQTNYNTTTEEDETTVVGTASTTIGISSSSWNSPASETVTADTNHPHGVKYTIAPSINLGYQVTQETGPGSTETIMVDIPDRTGLSISAADITSVYEAGRSAGLSALTWDITSWDYDDTNDVYQSAVRTWDGSTVIDTEYVSLPSLKTVVTNYTTKQNTWWKTSGTNANKYVIPGTSISAKAYLTTDSSSEHDVTTVVGKGSDIVIDPTEAVTAGQNSVNVVLDEWAMDQQDSNYGSSNQVTFKPSAGTGRTYTLSLLMNMDTQWSASHAKKVYVRPGNTSADPVMEVSVDASDRIGMASSAPLTVSQITEASYNALQADEISVVDDKYYKVTATPKYGTAVVKKFHTPAQAAVTQRTATSAGTITLTSNDTGTSVSKTTTVTYDDESTTSGVSVTVNANNVYVQGQKTVTPTSATISSSVANSSTGRRYSTLTVKYKGPDTQTYETDIANVDVTDIYNAGKNNGTQTSGQYPVTFKLSFTVGGTNTFSHYGNVSVNCANIYNQGAQDATPSTQYPYTATVIASSGSTVRMRSSPSTSAGTVTSVPVGATIYCYYDPSGYTDEWMPVKYGAYTGYMMSKFISGATPVEKEIYGVYSSGFSGSNVRVGIKVSGSTSLTAYILCSNKSAAYNCRGGVYDIASGTPSAVYSSSSLAIGKKCRIVYSDNSESGEFTILDENA